MPEPDLWSWVLAVVAGGFVGADAVAWPQVMVSRPLVAATVGGALMGRPADGMLVGAILELLTLRHPPFGAARYPDTGPAGLVAGAAFGAAGHAGPAALAVSVALGWVLGWIGARSVRLLRSLNARLLADVSGLARVPARLERRQRLGVALDFGRGAVLTAAFLVPATLLARAAPPAPGGTPGAFVVGALVLATGAAAGAIAGSAAGGRRAWLLLAAGVAVALGVGWLA